MLVLPLLGCFLFEPDTTDAPPPPPPPVEVPVLEPEPVPRDTGDLVPSADDTLSGSWSGPCTFAGGGPPDSGTYFAGGSGTPLPGGSGGYGGYGQAASIGMELVEVEGGSIFGGATIAVTYGPEEGFTFGSGVTGQRTGDDVSLAFAIGDLPTGSFEGTWQRMDDALSGSIRFEGYGQKGSCTFTR